MENQPEERKFTTTWLFKWFLNSQAVTALLVLLLIFLNLFLFSKVNFILTPIISFLGIVLLPIVLAGLLYYMLNPMVDFLEKNKVPRLGGITLVFILIILLIVWGLTVFIPSVESQIINFTNNAPTYIREVNNFIDDILENNHFVDYSDQLQELLNSFTSQAISMVRNFSGNALSLIGTVVGTASQIIMAIVMMPFILFYLLRDGHHLKFHLTKFLPTKWREPIGQVLTDVNNQLANYVRGQVSVAIIVALMFSLMFSVVGLKYAVTLGVAAGFLNLIPYLGSFLAMVPAIVLAIIQGPFMLVKVLIVFVIEQTIEGRFVSPLILGSQLQIHPITILFVLLTAGQMYGVWGVLLAIPIYASVKVVVAAIFKWYAQNSQLYTEADPQLQVESEEVLE